MAGTGGGSGGMGARGHFPHTLEKVLILLLTFEPNVYMYHVHWGFFFVTSGVNNSLNLNETNLKNGTKFPEIINVQKFH